MYLLQIDQILVCLLPGWASNLSGIMPNFDFFKSDHIQQGERPTIKDLVEEIQKKNTFQQKDEVESSDTWHLSLFQI